MGEPDLVGVTEIGRRAGVGRACVSNWRKRHEDFPAPVLELATGPVWLWPPVRDWLTVTGRLTPEQIEARGRELMTFTLTMTTDTAAFADDGACFEIARILREAADRIEAGHSDAGLLRDGNGNTVGRYDYLA